VEYLSLVALALSAVALVLTLQVRRSTAPRGYGDRDTDAAHHRHPRFPVGIRTA